MNDFFKKKQTVFFFICCGLCIGAILIRYAKLAMLPVSASSPAREIVERGSIVDRSGFPLAVQTNFYHVGVTLRNIRDNKKVREAFTSDVAPLLNMSESQLNELLDTKKSFVYLKKKIVQTEYEALKKITEDKNYNFVSYEKIPGRNYPNHALASQLIGYMGNDGKGLAGIEFSQQKILQPDISEDPAQQEQGRNIYLTIDANLQYKLEQIAYKTMANTQAESMMLVAADCTTGEILSYISLPSVDLNEYGESTEESRMDRPAMYSYEPGSVFKIFTVGIAYDQHGISPNDSFLCDGVYEKKLSSGERIRIKCLEHHGWCTPRDALRFSCNDALGQIADRVYDDDFIARIRQLGFGTKTGVELPGETSGVVKDTDSKSWSARSKPTIAIGQEITVSALQMVQAASAIANGGVPVQLTFIHKITNKDGTVFYEHTPEYKSRNFSKATADYVLSCMETTATTGTGARANLHDVSIGVKTGTAQMADKVHGGYSTTDFLSNCISIFPIENPQIVLYIVVTKAKGETYAGRIVAPVIAEAADVIIDHLGMSREKAASFEHSGVINIRQNQAVTMGSYVPNLIGKSKKDLLPLITRKDVHFIINGSGWVTSQNPAPGTPVSEDMVIELNLE
ncbi:Cell division protein FtsI/penicillin-binding protein 2 [Treponema sp. JC4]|uniref:penicillin-binding protein n=1 Tax=Treponema sp. JC4 TaxID=1124982 RepID=UPI00025AFD75|nr:penicillin-binding protein [Treponema sp. JC4]EID84830.1 Cell division protein FtsI/penicillin-binding protein 2 [Treponema sp. JC4]